MSFLPTKSSFFPAFRAHPAGQKCRPSSVTFPRVTARLWGESRFEPEKLYHVSCNRTLLDQRRLCVTHNDLTGVITVTSGDTHCPKRWRDSDAVLGHWRVDEQGANLELACKVDGTNWLQRLLAGLRSNIFQREMGLIIDCVFYAERLVLRENPSLVGAMTWVHFASENARYDARLCLGPLFGASHVMRSVNALRAADRQSESPIWRELSRLVGWAQNLSGHGMQAEARAQLLTQLALLLAFDRTPTLDSAPHPNPPAVWAELDSVLHRRHPLRWSELASTLYSLQPTLMGCKATREGVLERLDQRTAPACIWLAPPEQDSTEIL